MQVINYSFKHMKVTCYYYFHIYYSFVVFLCKVWCSPLYMFFLCSMMQITIDAKVQNKYLVTLTKQKQHQHNLRGLLGNDIRAECSILWKQNLSQMRKRWWELKGGYPYGRWRLKEGWLNRACVLHTILDVGVRGKNYRKRPLLTYVN